MERLGEAEVMGGSGMDEGDEVRCGGCSGRIDWMG